MRVTLAICSSFALAAVATFVVATNAYSNLSHPGVLAAELMVLLALHMLRYLRLWISREILLCVAFESYALLSLAWTENMRLALPTVSAFLNFMLVLILFNALIAHHDLRATLAGMVGGFLVAAIKYTLTSGFPFSYPEDFSYNTIAGMYLIGFFLTAVFGAYLRITILPLVAGVICLLMIAATTSIKTNLGTALGIIGASVLYFRLSVKRFVKGVLVLAVLVAGVAYGVSSNPGLTERVQNGFARVSLGLAVLTNREADSGATHLGTRKGWEREGLKGWAASPVFGHGVEGFRSDFGITSHSTPIDLLYNSGIIGFGLFYAVFASIAWRLLLARQANRRNVRARIMVCVIAYLFISLSGLIYYEPFVAIFLGVAPALLMRLERGEYSSGQPAGSAGSRNPSA